jgi:hypothetical protein
VSLHKDAGTRPEHRYADRFLAPDRFQWESQASTTPHGAKGRRSIHHAEDGRAIHLFVRHTKKIDNSKGERFRYCGELDLLEHEGSQPIRAQFALKSPLDEVTWRFWQG